MKIQFSLLLLITLFSQCRVEEFPNKIEGEYLGNFYYEFQGTEQVRDALVTILEGENLNIQIVVDVFEPTSTDTLFQINLGAIKKTTSNFDVNPFVVEEKEIIGTGVFQKDNLTLQLQEKETQARYFLFTGNK